MGNLEPESHKIFLLNKETLLDVIQEVSAPPQKEILNISEACEILGLTRNSIYKLTSTRRIPHFKRGKFLYFKRQELYDWVEQGRIKTIEQLKSEL